jgi:hypothetical protein
MTQKYTVIDCETSTSGKSAVFQVQFTVAIPEGCTDVNKHVADFGEHLTKTIHERDDHSADWVNLHTISVDDPDSELTKTV